MWNFTVVLLYLIPIINKISAKGHYFISSPAVLAPNSEYNVAINVDAESTIKLCIHGTSFSKSETVDVQPSTSKLVTFNIPSDIKNENYTLAVKGLSGLKFTNSTDVTFKDSNYIILIETDRSNYVAGDLVQYRVFVLNSHTKPVRLDKELDIEIRDQDNHLIKEYKVKNPTNGVHSGKFQLSRELPIGTWSIYASINHQRIGKQIWIKDNLVPRIEVKVDIPEFISRDDGKFQATIRAKYNNGNPVLGDAILRFYSGFWYDKQKPNELLDTKTVPINGQSEVEFHLPDLPENNQASPFFFTDSYFIEATVVEKFTGKITNETANLFVRIQSYSIYPENLPNEFEPDVPFEITIRLSKFNGMRIHDTKNPVYVFSSVENTEKYMPDPSEPKRYFDENGLFTMTIKIADSENTTHHAIYAHYRNKDEYIGTVVNKRRYIPPPPPEQETPPVLPFDIKVETIDPTLDDEISVKVTSEKELQYFIFQIVGQGKLLISQYVKVPNKKEHTFRFRPTFDMRPFANIFVFYIDGENIVSKETTVFLERKLKNPLKITPMSEAKPGDDMSILIETDPNSFVGLLAVDENVFKDRSGNELRESDVFFKFYDFIPNTEYGGTRYPGKSSFLKSLTNANHPTEDPPQVSGRSPVEVSSGNSKKLIDSSSTPNTEIAKIETSAIKIQQKFYSTWLWETFNTDNSRNTTIIRKVPDAQTSWKLKSFSISPTSGIGITDEPTDLRVFKPLVVGIDLPHSVKLGEIVKVPLTVFNYEKRPIDVEINLYNEKDEFEFIEEATDQTNMSRKRHLSMLSETSASVYFAIRPKKIGHITLKCSATSAMVADTLQRLLLVEPEGVTQYRNQALLVDLREKSQQLDKINIEIPEGSVPDSTHIRVKISGNILEPFFYSLNGMIDTPTGNTQQNMFNMICNMMKLKYLKEIGKETPEITSKAKQFMELSYQRQLTYRNKDGSYNLFGGKNDQNAHGVWLTAYVTRFFNQAMNYISIDRDLIENSFDFLAKNQQKNGSFADPDTYSTLRRYNNVDDKGVPLTAFVLMTFLESRTQRPQHEQVIKKALEYIANNVNADSDLYSIAISAYVLQCADHSSKDSFREMLERRATINGDEKWWMQDGNNHLFLDDETTAYGLLTLVKSQSTSDLTPIVRWLISRRSSCQCFGSSPSGVAVLESLMKFTEKLPKGEENLIDATLEYDGLTMKLRSKQDDGNLFQTYDLPYSARNIKITSKGNGLALLQFTYKYNIINQDISSQFPLELHIDEKPMAKYFQLKACTKFTPPDTDMGLTRTAVMEINLPSGFVAVPEYFRDTKLTEHVKKVESTKDDTMVVIYLENLDNKEICPAIDAFQMFDVEERKPLSVLIYEFNDKSRLSRKFYAKLQ